MLTKRYVLIHLSENGIYRKFVRSVLSADPVDSDAALEILDDREDRKAESKDLFLGRAVADLACRVRGDTSRSRRPPKARELYEKADAEDEYGDTRATFEDMHPQGLGEQLARGDGDTGAQGDW